MSPKISIEAILNAIGGGLLSIGFGLGLLFGTIDVRVEGPAGISVAILFGLGLCVLLYAVMRRMISISGPLQSNIVESSESELTGRLAHLKRWRAKVAICFSAASTVLAFVLFFGGIPVAFIGFNFASGTNDIGLIMILTGIAVGVIAIASGLVSVLLGWIAWNSSGNFNWFLVAFALPFFQGGVYLVGAYLTK